jgi:hypothetical protein
MQVNCAKTKEQTETIFTPPDSLFLQLGLSLMLSLSDAVFDAKVPWKDTSLFPGKNAFRQIHFRPQRLNGSSYREKSDTTDLKVDRELSNKTNFKPVLSVRDLFITKNSKFVFFAKAKQLSNVRSQLQIFN